MKTAGRPVTVYLDKDMLTLVESWMKDRKVKTIGLAIQEIIEEGLKAVAESE